ncbi:hypothetical protein Amir_6353 [Actinosynnema mirum DSM 43827]|uniref:YcfA family protein n=1 Tax=Actinosynnema mirum (strain ATCC 29888 / DSM 43827 / JCM 3225 / NBRC 14064 / NCIMB 13271 / NRRL B-12336 / IMRU 3971 / 101) TaxID=446462 RepID=C6WJ79_ACTMD|nr:hypothetical protein Amir_6353 [Actinosynnema mirum DSM 43827]
MGTSNSDIKALLADLEEQGWRVVRGRYWKCYCPCAAKHLKTVKITPSDPNYITNLKGQLRRSTCWKEVGK